MIGLTSQGDDPLFLFWFSSKWCTYTIFNGLSLKRGTGNGQLGTGNGERGMRLTIYHKILQRVQFEGAEFIDGNSYLWFLRPVNVSTCHLLGHSFERRTANALILMKFRTLHKSRMVNSIVTIVICDSWRLSNLTRVNIGTCHLLGHSFEQKLQEIQFWRNLKLYINRKTWTQWWQNIFCNFCDLSILIPVSVGTCQFLGQSYGPITRNASTLMKFLTLYKSRVVNSIVTIVICDSWCLSSLTPVNIGTCHLSGHSFEKRLQELQFWWNLKLYINRRPWIQWRQIFL